MIVRILDEADWKHIETFTNVKRVFTDRNNITVVTDDDKCHQFEEMRYSISVEA